MKTLQRLTPNLLLLPLILISWSLARAQDEDSGQTPPPTAPYVAPLTGDFSMEKKFTYMSDPSVHLTDAQKAAQDFLSPSATKPAQVDAISTGGLRKDTEHFVNGSSCEIWRFQIYRFSVYSANPNYVSLDYVDPNHNAHSLNQNQDAADFSELSWITGSAYQGIQMQQGKKCYAYKNNDVTAWIEISTRRPVYLQSKTLQVIYTFSEPPDEPLQLPKGYLEKLANFKRTLRGQM